MNGRKKHYSGKNNVDKKENRFKRLITALLSLSAGAIIPILVAYYFFPFFTKTEINILASNVGQINESEELIPILYEGSGCIEIYLHNDNNGLMRIENIYIDLCNYDELKDISIPDIGGQGGLEESIPLKGTIDPDTARSKAEINYDLLEDSTNEMQYISLEPNTADRYILSPAVTREGIYEICIEFEYYYHGKTHHKSTEKVKFIYTDPYQQQASNGETKMTDLEDTEETSPEEESFWEGPFNWREGYEEALENITDYLPIDDQTECSLKDLNFDNVPELHIVTMIGAEELLSNAIIFYYDEKKGLNYTEYQYNLENSPSPELFMDENGNYAWLTGYWEAEYEDESKRFDGSPFTKEWILYQGTDVRKVNFLYGQITEEVLVTVEGAKWKGVEPTEFSFSGKTYNNIDMFLDELKSTWAWRPVRENNSNIYIYPSDRTLDQQTIHKFLESYHPLF